MLFLTVLYFLAGYTHLAFSSPWHLNEISPRHSYQISCTITLLQKYFQSGEALSGSVITMSFTSASAIIQQELLNAIHAQDIVPWSIVVRQPSRLSVESASATTILHEKPQCYFIVIENLEDGDLENAYEDFKSNINWNPIAQFVIFLNTVEESDEDMNDLMIDIMLNLMNKKVYNVNVIGRHKGYQFYCAKTAFPYHPDNNCGSRVIEIETLDICNYEVDKLESEEYADDEDREENWNEVEDQLEYEDGDSDEDGEEDRDKVGDELENGDREKDGGTDGDRQADRDGDRDGGKYGDRDGDIDGTRDGDRASDRDGDKVGGKEGGRDRDRDRAIDGNGDRDGDEDELEDVDGEKKRDRDGDSKRNSNRDRYEDVNEDTKMEDGDKDRSGDRDGDEDELEDGDRGRKGGRDVVMDGSRIGERVGDKDEDRSGEADYFENGDGGNKINERAIMDKGAYEDALEDEDKEKEDKGINGVENESQKNSDEAGNNSEYGGVYRESIAKRINLKRVGKEETAKKSKISRKRNIRSSGSTHNLTTKLREDLQSARRDRRSSIPLQIQLQEMRRGLFADKVPKDLSGCPIVAAYRAWEPYIFKEQRTNEVKHKAENGEEHKKTDSSKSSTSSDESKNFIYEYVYSATDDDSYTDIESHTYSDSGDAAYSSDVSEDKPRIKLNGIEYQLIQTIGEVLHVNIDLQVENGNLFLLFQQLIDGEVEMIFGGIDEDPSISQYVSSAIPYHQDDLTWCVAKAKREYNFYNIFQSFNVSTWLLTIAVILIASSTIVVIQKLQKLRLYQFDGVFATVGRTYGIVLGQSAFIWRGPQSMRIVLLCTCFFSVIFVNFYQSFLVSTLTTPISAYQISHLEELYRNRIAVMGSAESVRHLNKEGEIFKYIRENFQICYNIEQCLNHAATNNHIAVAVSRQYSLYNPRIRRDQLYCFDRNENIYIYLVTMLLPKKFHLLHKINPIIQHVIESGHMEKWASELDMRHKIRDKIHQAQRETVKALTIDQIVGSFALHGLILAGACVTFLVECWTYWMVVRRRTRLRFIRLLHYKFF